MQPRISAIFLVALIAFSYEAEVVTLPDNPCPSIFSYSLQDGVYEGFVHIKNNDGLVYNLTLETTIATFPLEGNLNVTLLTDYEKINDGEDLLYKVEFPSQNVLPRVTRIALNDYEICSGPEDPLIYPGVSYRYYMTYLLLQRPISWTWTSTTPSSIFTNIPIYTSKSVTLLPKHQFPSNFPTANSSVRPTGKFAIRERNL